MIIYVKVKSLVQFNMEGLGMLGVLEHQKRLGAQDAACGSHESWSCQREGCAQARGVQLAMAVP